MNGFGDKRIGLSSFTRAEDRTQEPVVGHLFGPLSLTSSHSVTATKYVLIGLHHPLDGMTNPEYMLLRFIQLTNVFLQREEGTSF